MNIADASVTDEQSPAIPEETLRAFARELRRLAIQVERDLRRDEHVSALSALTAIKPLTGALTDAALSKVMTPMEERIDSTSGATVAPHDNPLGYL